jgi:crotonobetainyl-CoA:carnitine CoA-transferase CaiB-like acyl-CoA transferase
MSGPLHGVRILGLTQYGAGPFSTLFLADLGAEVLIVEDPTTGGDVGRYIPPYAEGQDSLFFQAFNASRSTCGRLPAGRHLTGWW